MLNLSNILSSRRKELGYSMKQLSTKTGISSTSLTKYEKGKGLPTVDNLHKIATVLKLDYNNVCDILLEEKRSRKE